MKTPHRFPTLEDFNDDVLDVRDDSSPEAFHHLGDYRLVQVCRLIERLRLEQASGTADRLRQEALLSGMEALLMDAHLMYARAHGQTGSKA
ncbi:hypothetical protein Pres01_17530 [Metapseudomonas resinovorans]|uniref:hypothetical protein n=1 Tax=Metapseudomonas resinovorans TaxID=53412 RepID=UPI000985732E|nr:hypothetical protein [Pseudomonas resinovorans]GLZ85702.1 hypothetical protein Pres01_17530 [Pseudomonas resinovorans]